MEETAPAANAVFLRKVRPPIDIAALMVITIIIVFLLSKFSFGTASAVGCFAGFCLAAWNWLQMGRRRKALVHFIAAFGVYAFMLIASSLIVTSLERLFVQAEPTLVEAPGLPGLLLPSGNVTEWPNQWVPSVGAFLLNILISVLVIIYLFRATARDVRQYEAASDQVEFYNLLPFVGVAVLSSAFIAGSTTFVYQIPVAQFQNHVYCEILQSGVSLYEVSQALNKLGTNYRFDVEKGRFPPHVQGVSYYQDVMWEDIRFDVRYDLSLRLGFTLESKLASVERRQIDYPWSSSKVITCPWTVLNSLAAK